MKLVNLLFCAANPRSSLPLKGPPISPRFPPDAVLVRYMYDGGVISNGRICLLEPSRTDVATGAELLGALRDDGVDLDRFYASTYETEASGGGWFPVLRDDQGGDDDGEGGRDDVELPITPPPDVEGAVARRIDVKLFRRPNPGLPERPFDAALAEAASQPTGKMDAPSYFGVGVIGAKTQANVGTLWRSAYQLGASFLFTIGQRYRTQSTDTLQTPNRIPLFELDDWTAFATFAPRGARWVAVEMGGTPLEEFDHPNDAVYILGSEDHGVPKSIVRACHDVVSLDSEQYASYNVAVAASIVLYDRMAKMKAAEKQSNMNGRDEEGH